MAINTCPKEQIMHKDFSFALTVCLFVCMFDLALYVPVNIYGHVGTVSSPNHTFLRKLE